MFQESRVIEERSCMPSTQHRVWYMALANAIVPSPNEKISKAPEARVNPRFFLSQELY